MAGFRLSSPLAELKLKRLPSSPVASGRGAFSRATSSLHNHLDSLGYGVRDFGGGAKRADGTGLRFLRPLLSSTFYSRGFMLTSQMATTAIVVRSGLDHSWISQKLLGQGSSSGNSLLSWGVVGNAQ